MALDGEVEKELRRSARLPAIAAALGAVAVFGFIAAAVADPDRMAAASNSDQSPGWYSVVVGALFVGSVALILGAIGIVRVFRKRRALRRAPWVRLPARWAPVRQRAQ